MGANRVTKLKTSVFWVWGWKSNAGLERIGHGESVDGEADTASEWLISDISGIGVEYLLVRLDHHIGWTTNTRAETHGASEDDEGGPNKIHLAGWHEAKPAQQKISPHQRRAAAVLVLRVHHVGTSAGSERSEQPREPHMSMADEELGKANES